MKKAKGMSKETLRGISEGLTEVKVDEEEREEMLIRIGELLDGIKALDEIELNAFSAYTLVSLLLTKIAISSIHLFIKLPESL